MSSAIPLGGVVGLELVSRAPSRVRSLITYGTTYRINWPWISLMALNLFIGWPGRNFMPR